MKEKVVTGIYGLILVMICITCVIHQNHVDDIMEKEKMDESVIDPKYKEILPDFYIYLSDKEIIKINNKEQSVIVRIKIMNKSDAFLLYTKDLKLIDNKGNSYEPDPSKVYYDECRVTKDGSYNKMFAYKIPIKANPKKIKGNFIKGQTKYFDIDLNTAY